MPSKKQSSSSKHLDFIALLRSSIHIPEKQAGPLPVAVDKDAENEAVSQLQKEL